MACKKPNQPNNTTNTTSATTESSNTISTVAKTRTAYGKVDADFLAKSKSAKPYLMITDSLWLFFVAIDPFQDKPKPILFEKTWLDLKENGEFEFGKAETIIDKGRFVYDDKMLTLEMRSEIKDSASMWKVKVDPDAMLLIGTEKYANNPWQIKLARKSNYNQTPR